MPLYQAVILGIVQGLTEFLPVSSSGHLILVRDLLGWSALSDPHLAKTFDVALHFGTFVGVTGYFWGRIGPLVRAWVDSIRTRSLAGDCNRTLSWLIVLSMIPAAVVGWKGEDFIETKLGDPLMVSALVLIFAFVLLWADMTSRKRRELTDLTWRDALIIGLAQCLALAPGVSRSGITLSAALFRNVRREPAARFVFLISIPIIGGIALYKLHEVITAGLPASLVAPFVAGIIAAGVSGYLCIHFFLSYLQRHTLRPFVVYRIALGVGLVAFYLAR